MNIAVFAADYSLSENAKALAERLNLPLALSDQESFDYLLVLTPDYLALQKTNDPSSPLYIDFLHGKINYRAKRASIKNETLARAMGLKGKIHPRIIDATGGLAADSFMLASLGFEVTLVERSPIIYVLLEDGMRRAKEDPHTASIVSRIKLVHADALLWLQELAKEDRPDIIYLDPMFPQRKKSALPQKKMLILHDVVGEDADASRLLNTALACAIKRVVVKRPRLAEILALSPVPSFALLGSSSRFDVYLL